MQRAGFDGPIRLPRTEFSESFSKTWVDVMAHGLPVIAFVVGAVRTWSAAMVNGASWSPRKRAALVKCSAM
jgi:hypothetical protein